MKIEEAERVLGVVVAGEARELRDAYRRAAFREHPDRGGDPAAFRSIKEAYRTLSSLAAQAPCPVRTLEGLVRERSDMSVSGASSGRRAADEDDGLGAWLKRQVPAEARPPEKVAFERFHDTFASLARPGCGTLVPTRVRELPMSCGMGAAPIHGGGPRDRTFDSPGGGKLGFSDLRSAYG